MREKKDKGRDKRQGFQERPDAGILDDLLEGGRISNAAGLAGELKEIEEVTELCGLRFNGYLAKVETPRPRGTLDEVMVAFTGKAAGAEGNPEIEEIRKRITGRKVLASGIVQTLKDFKSGRVLVFVLANFIRTAENPMMQDDVALRGVIVRDPVYRTTPKGRRITELFVTVENVITGAGCHIPCICWQADADEAALWRKGDTVELLGRYQSRRYEKVTDDGSGGRERRTAHEISVRLIKRKERSGNED